MPFFQVDYRIQADGFEQIEADNEEDAIQKVTDRLDGSVVTIEAIELASSAAQWKGK